VRETGLAVKNGLGRILQSANRQRVRETGLAVKNGLGRIFRSGQQSLNAYREKHSNNRRKFANMNYNTQLMKFVPKGTATRAVVGGFKSNAFLKGTQGGLERLNPFSGTAFFGPSRPGYVNNKGIARTAASQKQANNAAARKKANNNAASQKQLLNRLGNEEARRLGIPTNQNRLANEIKRKEAERLGLV
jgi:hypothetical protein